MSLFWKYCTSRNKRQVAFATFCSHPLQYGEVGWVIQTRSGWSRLHPFSRLCLCGTGSSKGISKHTEAVHVGGLVSWFSYRSCVWRTWLELLSLQPSSCCAMGMRAWAGHFTSLLHLYSALWLYSVLLCVTYLTEKPVNCLNSFCLAVHQITLGNRPAPALLIISI